MVGTAILEQENKKITEELVSLDVLINRILKRLSMNKEKLELAGFISDGQKAVDFINKLLNSEVYEQPNENSNLHSIAQDRAQHIILTYMIGEVLWPFAKSFLPQKTSLGDTDLHRLWLYISLYHDLGYFSELIQKDDLNYKEYFKYYLFTDNNKSDFLKSLDNFSLEHKDAFAFSYDEILQYDAYAREYHKEKTVHSKEKLDHGILGAQLAYNRLVKKLENAVADGKPAYLQDLNVYKYICIIIAQHNLYKSNSEKTDKKYGAELCKKLGYMSEFRISQNTPLLLFLSLVDTIEFIKKFGKGNIGKKGYLEAMTSLKSVKLFITCDKIVLDYSALKGIWDEKKRTVEDKNKIDTYNKYFDAVSQLDEWTVFHTVPEQEACKITITL